MFNKEDILYEDNHIMIIYKNAGDIVQSDTSGDPSLENDIKEFIKFRDNKPGNVYLGVVHRIDRPVSGVVLFAKTSKALARLNEMIKNREIKKKYWAITEKAPDPEEGELKHYIERDSKKNKSHAYSSPKGDSKEAILKYKLYGASSNFYLIKVDLVTGRHHQIRCQLSKIGCPIKGDLKYGAKRSNKDKGISLHARSIEFIHPVTKVAINITARTPKDDNLWRYFESIR